MEREKTLAFLAEKLDWNPIRGNCQIDGHFYNIVFNLLNGKIVLRIFDYGMFEDIKEEDMIGIVGVTNTRFIFRYKKGNEEKEILINPYAEEVMGWIHKLIDDNEGARN